MPLSQNLNAFLGAAVLGVISAAGMYLVERYRQEKVRYAMANDLARLDQELAQVKRDLQQLLTQKQEKSSKSKRTPRQSSRRTNSTVSTSDDYLSVSNIDSSDLEFYDVSDDENEVASTNLNNILTEIDRKLDTGSQSDIEEVLKKLQDFCIEFPENPDLLWRIGKAHHKLADASDDKIFIQEHIARGIDACYLALKLNPNSAEIHKWYAILIGGRSEFQSMQDKISDGHLFKKHVDAAIAIDPKDASLHHMLGRFDYEVACLKWYERKVAATLFGEPPTATFSEAIEHFLQAEELANFEWKENKLMIAKCKIAQSDYREAIKWLISASKCKQGDGLDDKIDSEVKALLQKYNGYRH